MSLFKAMIIQSILRVIVIIIVLAFSYLTKEYRCLLLLILTALIPMPEYKVVGK